MAQASNGFTPQYPPNHQSSPVPFNQTQYQGYPQNFVHGGQRPPLDPNPFNSGPQRGRGNTNFRGRGRGDFVFRGNNNHHHQSNGHRATSENYHKPTGVDASGKKNKKKRKTNTLGLTPNGVDHDDSEDDLDEVDEEARLVTLLGPDTPQYVPFIVKNGRLVLLANIS